MYAITIFNRISVSDMCKIIIGVCFVKSFKQQIHPLKKCLVLSFKLQTLISELG